MVHKEGYSGDVDDDNNVVEKMEWKWQAFYIISAISNKWSISCEEDDGKMSSFRGLSLSLAVRQKGIENDPS